MKKANFFISDKETGQKIPCRITIKGQDDEYYCPERSLSFAKLMPSGLKLHGFYPAEPFFYSDGEFSLRVPLRKIEVTVNHGFEYKRTVKEINITSQTKFIKIEMMRIADMAKEGWYSGDTHIHLTHAPCHYKLKVKDGLFLAMAEDLNVVNFLDDRKLFQGQVNKYSATNRLIYFGYELGHQSILNIKRPPQLNKDSFTYDRKWYSGNDWVHRQGGTVVMGHPFHRNHLYANLFTDDGQHNLNHYEIPINAALGKIDAYDFQYNISFPLTIWYGLLNCGIKLPISAGSDTGPCAKHSLPIGFIRTYVKVNEKISYANWLQGLKKGESFVTNGPLLFFKINGHHPGSTSRLQEIKNNKSILEVGLRSAFPCSGYLEIIKDGKIIYSMTLKKANSYFQKLNMKIQESGWLALRYRDKNNIELVFAHTNPFYIIGKKEKRKSVKDAKFFIDWIDLFVASRFPCPKSINPSSRGGKLKDIRSLVAMARKRYLSLLPPSQKKFYYQRDIPFNKEDFEAVGPNLIKNQAGWKLNRGGRGSIKQKTLSMYRKKNEKSYLTLIYRYVELKNNNYYILKGCLRSRNKRDPFIPWGGLGGGLAVLDIKGNILGGTRDRMPEKGNDWVEHSCLIYINKNMAPKVMIACVFERAGKIEFKDIELRKCQGNFINMD